MPSKTHDRPGQGSESRERRKHRPHRTKRKSSSRLDVTDEGAGLERSSTLADPTTRRRSSMPVPELSHRPSSASPNGSKTSLPYPSFSKAHSREAVGSTENIITPRQNVFTPDPTDLQRRKGNQDDKTTRVRTTPPTINGPPSPPLTAVDQAAVLEDKRKTLETRGEEMRRKLSETRKRGSLLSDKLRSSSARSSPYRPAKEGDGSNISAVHRSKSGTPAKMKPKHVTIDTESSLGASLKSRSPSPAPSRTDIETTTESMIESDTTSIAPEQHRLQMPFSPEADDESSPTTGPDSSPRTPTPRGTPFPPSRKETPAYDVPIHIPYGMGNEDSPMPPPPPPPPAVPFQNPKVDYLMQHGGLAHPVPKTFLIAPDPGKIQFNPNPELPNQAVMAAHVQKFFEPFNGLLEDYMNVISKNGSIAVATGYRSIARRLLDRLEAVFARDISSEICTCIMCQSVTYEGQDVEEEGGISWGEILEYVCGRRELPPWPAFALDHMSVGLGISAAATHLPMQKLDIDVPEEYRDHYVRQSKKTKQSVDQWLAGQSENNPPEDADDDTLTFAMLTHLEPEQRPTFKELLGVVATRPGSVRPGLRASTPLNTPQTDLLTKTALAIQRLYRLSSQPRAPESAIYLLNNPHLHNVLATLAAVSDGEWDILTSGRFDGFLRSGAEEAPSAPVSRGPTPANVRGIPSRGPTPLPTSSTPAPASAGAPVAMDEETEIAVLAEVEREIYLGMEALEDAFEALHLKAETVRRTLRERGAGLSMASQARRGGALVEARLGTPASAFGGLGGRGWDSETDDGIDDGASELAPDDSASNVSRSRVRRPKRRNERRTPAPVEEEDEEGEAVWERGGRR